MELKMEDVKTNPRKNLVDEMQQRILQNVFDLLTTGVHGDLTVVLKDGETTGSRVFLAALSPYFNTMLSADMKEKNSGIIHLPTVSLATYNNISKAHFLREDVVKEDNFFDLFEASQMMELSYLEKICFWNIENFLSFDNSLDIFRLLKLHGHEEQAQNILNFLVDNFHDFSLTDVLTELTQRELTDIISSKDVGCEELDVLKAVIKWIEYNNPSAADVTELFSHVHVELVDPEYLARNIVYSTLATENNAVKAIIRKALKNNLNAFAKHRSDLEEIEMLVAFGNERWKTLLFLASLTERKWYRIPSAPFGLGQFCSATSSQSKVYITGGDGTTRSTLIYDILKRRWSEGPTLNDDRCGHCMAMVGDIVYAIGGSNSSTVECLDEQLGRWEVVGDLGVRRGRSCPSVVVGNNILVSGGDEIICYATEGDSHEYNEATEILCLNTDTCTVSKAGYVPPYFTSVLVYSNLIDAYSDLPMLYVLSDNELHSYKVKESDNNIVLEHISRTDVPHEVHSCNLCLFSSSGDLLVYTNRGIVRFQDIYGQKKLSPEKEEFPIPPLTARISGFLLMHLPKYILHSTDASPHEDESTNK